MGKISKKEEREELLVLARKAIETAFTKKNLDLNPYKRWKDKRGIFVTLTKDDKLRGCIGFLKERFPLFEGVVKAARAAAFEDPRFPPLEPEELGSIRIEISILTPAELVSVQRPEEYLKKIKVGRDGLIIKQGFYSGLLLPQVPVEYGWNIETYLEQLCHKAGLPIKAWKEPKSTIESFQADILSEK